MKCMAQPPPVYPAHVAPGGLSYTRTEDGEEALVSSDGSQVMMQVGKNTELSLCCRCLLPCHGFVACCLSVHCLSHRLSLPLCLSLSLFVSLCLCLSVSLPLCLSLSLCLSLYLCLSVSVILSLSFCISVAFSLSIVLAPGDCLLSASCVASQWEKPYMEVCVDALKISPFSDVLEIGFGLAYSADRIQQARPRSHTVVECDAVVLQRLRVWAKTRPNVRVVEGRWQGAE